MKNKGMTTLEVKQINKARVYSCIYQEKITSKLQIVQTLEMSLSTVTQNLKALEDENLIEKNGFMDSTGGRKSQAIQINRTARIAIGIGILKDFVHFVAVDLYGNVTQTNTIELPYQPNQQYYEHIGSTLKAFIESGRIAEESILGVSIAVQGIISTEGDCVKYGAIMENQQMTLEDFKKQIPYPCRLEHDSKAAGFLELWTHPEIENAVIFLLNRNFGGALIVNRQLFRGLHMQSGLLEHLCIDSQGPSCYCGQRGCLETFCSANALMCTAGVDITTFFALVHQGELNYAEIWKEYLKHLAFAIRNVNIMMDSTIVLSGYLAPYFTDADIDMLCQYINESNVFPIGKEQLLIGTKGQYTPAIGAALFYIDRFLTF